MNERVNLAVLTLPRLRASKPSSAELDEISLKLARGFLDGVYTFNEADSAMNQIFAYLTQGDFLTNSGEIIWNASWDIFQAFDGGEFIHKGDGPEIDPVTKYTVPMLNEALKSYPLLTFR